MSAATIALTVMSFSLFLIFLGFLVWGWKSGQFKNVEEAKYVVFRNDNSIPEDDGTNNNDHQPGR